MVCSSFNASSDGFSSRVHMPHACGRDGGERSPGQAARAQLARPFTRRTQLRGRTLHRLHQELAADRSVTYIVRYPEKIYNFSHIEIRDFMSFGKSDLFPGMQMDRPVEDELHASHCCLVAIGRLQVDYFQIT